MSFYKRVYEVVKQIPKRQGYDIHDCRYLRQPESRQVCRLCTSFKQKPDIIPCHRVVNRFGQLSHSFAFGGIEAQKAMLEDEGVFVNEEYCVNLSKYLHHWK